MSPPMSIMTWLLCSAMSLPSECAISRKTLQGYRAKNDLKLDISSVYTRDKTERETSETTYLLAQRHGTCLQ
jgi:hypothetical protein